MTRYIGEPTDQRQFSTLGFDKDQLQRRPRPSGGTTHPWAMLRDGFTSVSAPSASWPVNFQIATKNHDPNDDYFSWTTSDGGDAGNFRFVLTLKKEGIYLIDCVVNWNDTGTGTGTARLAVNPSNSYNPFGSGDEKFDAQVGGDWNTAGDIQASAVQRVFMLYSANANCTLAPTITITGVTGTRGLNGEYLKALYLEEHGDTADWVFAEIPAGS